MFTPGPSMMSLPRVRASCPMASPSLKPRSGFHVAARQIPAGMAVEKSSVCPAGCQVSGPTSSRTPCGPSDIQRRGMPRRGIAAVVNFESAWMMEIFSSSVSRDKQIFDARFDWLADVQIKGLGFRAKRRSAGNEAQ